MGCAVSTLAPPGSHPEDEACRLLLRAACCDAMTNILVVPGLAHPGLACAPTTGQTSIQDLPLLLLARILALTGDWAGLFCSVQLVCKAWHRLVRQHATPERLSFAFDVVAPPSYKQHAQQLPERLPWAAWLAAHGSRLHDFSASVAAAHPALAGCQVELKDAVLQALAGNSSSSSRRASSNAASSSLAKASSNSSLARSSSASSFISLRRRSSGSSSSSSSASTTGDDIDSQPPAPVPVAPLQLRCLHLKLPLFEGDVLLLAQQVCPRAPHLSSLTLVGFTDSGGARSSSTGSSSASASANSSSPGSQGNSALAGDIAPLLSLPAAAPAPRSISAPLLPVSARGAAQLPQQQGFITGASLQQLVASAPQLTQLTFASRTLYKTGWLAPVTRQLRQLALRECHLVEGGLRELAAMGPWPCLRSLDLSGNPDLGGSSAAACIALLPRISGALTCVDISGWRLGDACVRRRSQQHQQQQLQQQQHAAAAVHRLLRPLSSLRALGELRAEGCGLLEWSASALAGLQSLHTLSLAHNPLSCSGVRAVCSMAQLQHQKQPALRCLDLSGVAPRGALLTFDGDADGGSGGGRTAQPAACCWRGLHGAPAGLQQLRLCENNFPDCQSAVTRAFMRGVVPWVAGMPRLLLLDLGGCKLPHKLLGSLLAALPASVEELVLDGCIGVTRSDLSVLPRLPQLTRLSAAALAPRIRDKHAPLLAGATRLRQLRLSGSDLSSKGVGVLVAGLPRLLRLDVSGSPQLLALGVASGLPQLASGGAVIV